MKKYVVKYKEGEKVFGEFSSRKEAANELTDYIHNFNKENKNFELLYLSPFDFTIEEVERKEVNEVITDFESAKKYLVGNTNDVFGVVKKRLSKNIDPIKDAEILIKELNPKHIEALIALNELFTIAEAWNKADGFVPDFSNLEEDKYFPWFVYDRKAARFVSAYASYAPSYVLASFGCRLCFKTRDRATQFGKQFADLYNKVFL